MKLTKEQFVKHVNYLIEINKGTNELCRCLEISDCVLDTWFDHYFTLVEDLCEFSEPFYDTWIGSPLAYWIFTAEGEYSSTAYIGLEGEKIYFHSTEEVYDFIVNSTT